LLLFLAVVGFALYVFAGSDSADRSIDSNYDDIAEISMNPEDFSNDTVKVTGDFYWVGGGVIEHSVEGNEDYVVEDSDGFQLDVRCDAGPERPNGDSFSVEAEVSEDSHLGDDYVYLDCVSAIS